QDAESSVGRALFTHKERVGLAARRKLAVDLPRAVATSPALRSPPRRGSGFVRALLPVEILHHRLHRGARFVSPPDAGQDIVVFIGCETDLPKRTKVTSPCPQIRDRALYPFASHKRAGYLHPG